MAKEIMTIPQVKHFLNTIYELLDAEDTWEINNMP